MWLHLHLSDLSGYEQDLDDSNHRLDYVRAQGDLGALPGGDEGVGDRSAHARRLLADLVADDALLLVPPMVADEIEKRACVACGVTGSTPKGGGATDCCLVPVASLNTPCRFIPALVPAA